MKVQNWVISFGQKSCFSRPRQLVISKVNIRYYRSMEMTKQLDKIWDNLEAVSEDSQPCPIYFAIANKFATMPMPIITVTG